MFDMTSMHSVHLDGLDLNLLRVLDAILVERHLTRAARRIGLSQSATSHSLARLRERLGDPLVVRTPGGLVPTARGAQLAEPLRHALATLERAWAGEPRFDPATAQRSFSIATADYGSFVLIPRLLERVAVEAPGVNLWVRTVAEDPWSQLATGQADLLCGPLPDGPVPEAVHARLLYEERFVVVLRKGHPRVRKRLDLDTWASLTHVFVAPRGTPGGVVDTVLASHHRARRVGLAVPHFLVAPHVVAGSDMVATLGARVAAAFTKLLPLKVFEPPVPVPGFKVYLAWHARTHDDPAMKWLRALLLTLFRDKSTRARESVTR